MTDGGGRVFHLPDLGEGLAEAELLSWEVHPGDHVVADQPLASVETDKAVVEIPSPWPGHIARLMAEPGDHVKVGAPLVEFAEAAHADKGAIVGEMPQATDSAPTLPAAPRPARPGGRPDAKIHAVPAARALAARQKVDLSTVTGTGPDGAITREDVAAAGGAQAGPGTEPLHGMRRSMARRMSEAGASVVPATVMEEADIGAWAEKTDITARIVRAMTAACAAEPSLNAWFDSDKGERELHAHVDLGIAVDTRDGLIVPVLRGADGMDPAEVRRALDILVDAARDRTLAAADLSGATITLSNFGTIGGRYAHMVIMPPQTAIIGTGRIAERVVAAQGAPVMSRGLPLSLTFDHRAVTGGEASRFLAALIADLEASN